MTIKIGEKTLAYRTPSDLDAVLIEATGCNAAETAAQLKRGGQPSHIARALYPFLTEKDLLVHDLAGLIADADVTDVRNQVIALYEPAPAAGKPQDPAKPQDAK